MTAWWEMTGDIALALQLHDDRLQPLHPGPESTTGGKQTGWWRRRELAAKSVACPEFRGCFFLPDGFPPGVPAA